MITNRYYKAALAAFVFYDFFLFPKSLLANDVFQLWVPDQLRSRLRFAISADHQAEVFIENNTVRVQFDSNQSQILQEGIEGLNNEILVQIDDFNFDGLQDIAVLGSYGYGGVNLFSNVYIYDSKTNLFRHLLTESNIRADDQERVLHTDQRSGPRTYTATYHFIQEQLYLLRETVSLGSDLQKNTIYDSAGQVEKIIITDLTQDLNRLLPAKRKIFARRAYLYSQPNEAAKTRAYVIHGDEVELLDSSGSWDEWLFIRYRGKSVLERWIKAETLFE